MVADAWADVTGRPKPEQHPDRWLLVGGTGGALGLALWMHAAGLQAWAAVVNVLLLVLFHLCLARLAAVLGMQTASLPTGPQGLSATIAGEPVLGASGKVLLNVHSRLTWFTQANSFFPMVLQGHKLGDVMGWRTSRYVTAMLIAGPVSLALYTFFYMRFQHQFGGLQHGGGGYASYAFDLYDTTATQLSALQEPSLLGGLTVLAGGAAMWGLMACHRSFSWWPVHPLGFILAPGYTSHTTWFGLTIGWLAKQAVAEYGGQALYMRLRPLFLGILLGDLAGDTVWTLASSLAMLAGRTVGRQL